MSVFQLSSEGVWIEIYRRAVKAYRGAVSSSWKECLSAATTSVQIELDVWLLSPQAA